MQGGKRRRVVPAGLPAARLQHAEVTALPQEVEAVRQQRAVGRGWGSQAAWVARRPGSSGGESAAGGAARDGSSGGGITIQDCIERERARRQGLGTADLDAALAAQRAYVEDCTHPCQRLKRRGAQREVERLEEERRRRLRGEHLAELDALAERYRRREEEVSRLQRAFQSGLGRASRRLHADYTVYPVAPTPGDGSGSGSAAAPASAIAAPGPAVASGAERLRQVVLDDLRRELTGELPPAYVNNTEVCELCGDLMQEVASAANLVCPTCHVARTCSDVGSAWNPAEGGGRAHGSGSGNGGKKDNGLHECLQKMQGMESACMKPERREALFHELWRSGGTGLEQYAETLAAASPDAPLPSYDAFLAALPPECRQEAEAAVAAFDADAMCKWLKAAKERLAAAGKDVSKWSCGAKDNHVYRTMAQMFGLNPLRFSREQLQELWMVARIAVPLFRKMAPLAATQLQGRFQTMVHQICRLRGWDALAQQFPLLAGKDRLAELEPWQEYVWKELLHTDYFRHDECLPPILRLPRDCPSPTAAEDAALFRHSRALAAAENAKPQDQRRSMAELEADLAAYFEALRSGEEAGATTTALASGNVGASGHAPGDQEDEDNDAAASGSCREHHR